MNDYGLVVIGFLECIAIGWFYGTDKLRAYINEVSDFDIGIWWDIFIKWVTPLVLGWALVSNVIKDIREPYGGYPGWALVAGGWGVIAAIVVVAALITRIKPVAAKEES